MSDNTAYSGAIGKAEKIIMIFASTINGFSYGRRIYIILTGILCWQHSVLVLICWYGKDRGSLYDYKKCKCLYGRFVPKDIYIEGDQFVGCEQKVSDKTEIDRMGCYAIPGLADIHFHGCVGHDFCDGTREAIDAMAVYEASVGVTNIVPATMTLGEDTLLEICKAAKAYKEEGRLEGRARLCGINMEGPFVAPSKKGAQNGDYIHMPDVEMFDKLNEASGSMAKLIAIAPEVEGAMEFIEKRHDKVAMSLAHTAADYDTAICAFQKGASHVTHLYNAMNPYTHRAPGVVGAAADTEKAEVELICDGVHIHPAAVRTTFKIFGDDRIILISDSMMATGLEDGDYSLGGQDVKYHPWEKSKCCIA